MSSLVAVYGQIVSVQRDIAAALASDVRLFADTGVMPLSLLLLAVGLGLLHALTPGHGKSIVFSYFIGHRARVVDGLTMAGQMACAHSLVAILLVIAVGGAASKWGRPSGAGATIQLVSYFMVAMMGLLYTYRAIRAAHGQSTPHVLPYAVGILPCPLTMLVVGNAMAAGSILVGLALAALVALGSTATITLFGATGILLRRTISASFDENSPHSAGAFKLIEIVSSLAIFLIGLWFLLGSLQRA